MERLKILVVDDNKAVRELLTVMLNEFGHEVVTAQNGQEGIAKCEKCDSFDLVITDRQMPGMLGEELIHRIKKIRPELSAILITSDCDSGLSQVAKAAGADEILIKPFQMKTMERVIKNLLERKGE